ncbi:2135_t:CDS:2 [Scutellospora calospora]|uniref:2135_t:CDS:1 n=1 Tax=Scutellospora calospora TaxID=85575 RepID=A0ACA9KSG5_9GLOM|nr:2135_t:CDS:2 [Scutellospora calospora]
MVETTSFILAKYGGLKELEKFSQALQYLFNQKKEKKPNLAEFKIPNKLNDLSNFFPLFKFIYQLTDDELSVSYVTEFIIHDFARDGVKYLELRSNPRKNDENGMTKDSYVRTVTSIIQKFPHSECDIIVRLILSINRRSTLEEAMEILNLAIKYKEFGVVGVDLCGDPKVGHIDNIKLVFIKAKSYGLKVTLHLGEAEETIPEHASMLSIAPDRIGHAAHLDPESKLCIFSNNIPIEMCMTSNVVCNIVKNYKEHHIKDFLYDNHPCCLSTDDKGVFFSNLSTEYSIAASTFSLSPKQLFDLSYRCINYIFESENVKENLRKVWNNWFNAYHLSILDENGSNVKNPIL